MVKPPRNKNGIQNASYFFWEGLFGIERDKWSEQLTLSQFNSLLLYMWPPSFNILLIKIREFS